jgi:carbon starvation protein
MSIGLIALIVIAIFLLAYRLYGRLLRRKFGLDDSRTTPAQTINDGVDFVPIRPALLLPQHFSAIAAAGPIVGPILAGLWFGWFPALLWIVLGNIFIGSVHDFSTLAASVRHGAQSIAEVFKAHISKKGALLFLLFIWISLIYVIVAFTDLTASTFLVEGYGGGVATSSGLYLLLAILLGFVMRVLPIPFPILAGMAIPLIGLTIWGGQYLPLSLAPVSFLTPAQAWGILILIYCCIASILPVSVLLQPRGFLGGYFLYGTLIIGIIGLLFGGYTAQYPAFVGLTNPKGAFLFPALFITVACGACSGFHGLVCGGTSSKQLDKECDAHAVGYGGMLLEGLVAVIALATIMMFPFGDAALAKGPTEIYARGLAQFANVVGVPMEIAMRFGLLAFATFVYDTLDVATRLGRHIFQELTGWQGVSGRIGATLATLLLPLFFLMNTKEAAYLKFWPIFGASNQLLAALSLLGISVWIIKTGKNAWYTIIPMIFLLAITVWALILFVKPSFLNLSPDVNGVVAAILLLITGLLFFEAYQTLTRHRKDAEKTD